MSHWLFLTGRDNEVDKILGLEIGADDYITKPFNPRELTIRARNLLSRFVVTLLYNHDYRLLIKYPLFLLFGYRSRKLSEYNRLRGG